jgi:hypothetical protein
MLTDSIAVTVAVPVVATNPKRATLSPLAILKKEVEPAVRSVSEVVAVGVVAIFM